MRRLKIAAVFMLLVSLLVLTLPVNPVLAQEQNIPPTITLQPVSQTVCAGNAVSFTSEASGVPFPSVQWQQSVDGGATWSDMPGEMNTTLTLTASLGDYGKMFRAVFTNLAGSATSEAAILVVTTAPVITLQPVSQTVNAGDTATFKATAIGTVTQFAQWQVSTDGGATWNDIPGAMQETLQFTAEPGDNGNRYRAVFTDDCGQTASDAATLTVISETSAPVITLQPLSITVCDGTDAVFMAGAVGNPEPSVQWQISEDHGATWQDIPGEMSPILVLHAVFDDFGHQYRAVFTNSAGTAISEAAVLTVSIPPEITLQPEDQTVNEGETASFNAKAMGTTTQYVQWQVSSGGGSAWSDIPGATYETYSFTASLADNGNQYRAVFTNSCGTTSTGAAVLTVAGPPALKVCIDINPGCDKDNVYYLKDKSFPIFVVVYGTCTFDVHQIDYCNVDFEGAKPGAQIRYRDDNADGIPDVVLTFLMRDTHLVCGQCEATLSGTTKDGQAFCGTDSITVK